MQSHFLTLIPSQRLSQRVQQPSDHQSHRRREHRRQTYRPAAAPASCTKSCALPTCRCAICKPSRRSVTLPVPKHHPVSHLRQPLADQHHALHIPAAPPSSAPHRSLRTSHPVRSAPPAPSAAPPSPAHTATDRSSPPTPTSPTCPASHHLQPRADLLQRPLQRTAYPPPIPAAHHSTASFAIFNRRPRASTSRSARCAPYTPPIAVPGHLPAHRRRAAPQTQPRRDLPVQQLLRQSRPRSPPAPTALETTPTPPPSHSPSPHPPQPPTPAPSHTPPPPQPQPPPSPDPARTPSQNATACGRKVCR